jgi:catechol 2,3-dioxygenase-like lactoylglutathione lyase family enzyme
VLDESLFNMKQPTVDSHFLGLRTVIYHAPDLEKAREWYSSVLGFGPYFDQPFYVGFNVGGYELGLDPMLPRRRSERAALRIGESRRPRGHSTAFWRSGLPSRAAYRRSATASRWLR